MEDKSDFIKISSFLCLLATSYLIYENNSILLKEYDLFSKKTPSAFKGFKVLHINNLYGKNFGEENYRLLDKINILKPDIILMTGQSLTSFLEKDFVFLKLCKSLRESYPVYYSLGEKETLNSKRGQGLGDFLKALKDMGIIILNNSKVSIIKKEERLNLYGIYIDKEKRKAYLKKNEEKSFLDKEIIKKLGKANKSEFNMVLTNDVINFGSYVRWGSDITFSGYTKVIKNYIFNNFVERKKDIFIKRDSSMVLSKGLGNSFFSIRLINRPEITLITLR